MVGGVIILRKYAFVNSVNTIIGVCTSDRELTADEVYPGIGCREVEVYNDDIIFNFSMYEFDGSTFSVKPIAEPSPSSTPTLEERLIALEETTNFLLGL